MPAINSVASPYEVFFDTNGAPLENGHIFIGTQGQNPETAPIAVYWDVDLTQPAVQPIRTLNGVPSRNGSPGTVYVAESDYSITVRNRALRLVYTTPFQLTRLSSAMVGYLPAGDGAVPHSLADTLDYGDVNVFSYLTDAQIASVKAGDLAVDVTTALQTIFAMVGARVILPAGNYKYSGDLAPVCAAIYGAGELATILTPTSAVANPLVLGVYGPRYMHGFQIDGVNTVGKIGLAAGKDTSCAGLIESVRVKRFTGSGAANMKVVRALKTRAVGVTLEGGQRNLILDGTGAPGYPTSFTFDTLICIDAVEEGCLAVDCESIVFNQPIFDSNGKEGFKVIPGASARAIVHLEQPRFEGNYGSTTTEYQMKVDGSAASCRAQAIVNDPQFSATASTAKAFLATGSGANFTLENPTLLSAAANAISCENGAYGEISEWQQNSGMTFATVVNDPLNRIGTDGWADPRTWTPTFNDSVSTGFASTTITNARYSRIGKKVLVNLDVGWVLAGAGTPVYIRITVPTGLTPSYSSTVMGWLSIAGTWQSGMCVAFTDGYIYFRKEDNSNFAAGSTCQFRVTLEYYV
jgi:hypothetical protein